MSTASLGLTVLVTVFHLLIAIAFTCIVYRLGQTKGRTASHAASSAVSSLRRVFIASCLSAHIGFVICLFVPFWSLRLLLLVFLSAEAWRFFNSMDDLSWVHKSEVKTAALNEAMSQPPIPGETTSDTLNRTSTKLQTSIEKKAEGST
jgi:type III secretory pathway component EscV